LLVLDVPNIPPEEQLQESRSRRIFIAIAIRILLFPATNPGKDPSPLHNVTWIANIQQNHGGAHIAIMIKSIHDQLVNRIKNAIITVSMASGDLWFD